MKVFCCVWCRIRIKANQIKSSKCSTKRYKNSIDKNLPAHECQCLLPLHLCPLTGQLWMDGEKNDLIENEYLIEFFWICRVRTCWWCASVCFISTIRMLCSMAYFFALATKSCWSDVNFGSAPLKMPSNGDREPGPNSTSPSCRRSFNGALIYGIFGCQSENMKIAMFINKPQAHAQYTIFVSVWNKWKLIAADLIQSHPSRRWWNFSQF